MFNSLWTWHLDVKMFFLQQIFSLFIKVGVANNSNDGFVLWQDAETEAA